MKVLIIGSGGREHAIGWKIKKDNPDVKLFFAPGNGGTLDLGKNEDLSSIEDIKNFAKGEHIDLTIVGPEAELVEGIVDLFKAENLKIFGPDKISAQLEGSKAFSKEFMIKHGVKTAESKTFKYYIDARKYIETLEDFPIVIKASGLAAGKGVVIAQDRYDAETALHQMMIEAEFGEAGKEVVVETFLKGFECSILSIYNGREITPFISAKDHKKIGEGETGLNTGGMGVIAPNPYFTESHMQDFIENILKPTERGLKEEDMNFAGVIFFGLMVTEKGVYLLEYNMRFGDPETEALLPLMKSNLLDVIKDSIEGKEISVEWEDKHSCCVVMASGGYPRNYEKGFVIKGLEKVESPLFMAGVKQINGKYLTDGGRVLNVVALGDTLEEARENAYKNIKYINFDFEYYRKDIGKTK